MNASRHCHCDHLWMGAQIFSAESAPTVRATVRLAVLSKSAAADHYAWRRHLPETTVPLKFSTTVRTGGRTSGR